jgi:hypothetical protein
MTLRETGSRSMSSANHALASAGSAVQENDKDVGGIRQISQRGPTVGEGI